MSSKGFLVTWEIDVEDAESFREAAERALDIMRDPESIATYFTVKEIDSDQSVDVDLSE